MKKVLAWVLFLHLIYFPPSLPSYFYCSRKYLKGLLGFSYSMSKKKKMLCLKPFKILGRSRRIKEEKLPQTPSRSSPELQRHHQGRLQLFLPATTAAAAATNAPTVTFWSPTDCRRLQQVTRPLYSGGCSSNRWIKDVQCAANLELLIIQQLLLWHWLQFRLAPF